MKHYTINAAPPQKRDPRDQQISKLIDENLALRLRLAVMCPDHSDIPGAGIHMAAQKGA